jgi:intracellular sulfur oxidation DsrE/DsrF family protein
MREARSRLVLARRSFLSRLGIGATAFGAAIGGNAAEAGGQGSPPSAQEKGRWQAAHHAQDDWLDEMPGKHRLIFDTTSVEGIGQALLFANNYLTANRNTYGLEDADLAVVIVVRHHSGPFGFTDAMWAKYGAGLAQRAGFADPNTKQPPTVNVFTSASYGTLLPNNGTTFDAVMKRGVRLAVCQLSTRASAGVIAQKTGGKAEDIYSELAANLIGNGRLVPAGIVAVTRAQERGFSFAYSG